MQNPFKIATNQKSKSLKGLARYGHLAFPADLFIWDECQRLRNLESARTKFALQTYDSNARHLWLSATAGQNPLELGYLLPLLARLTGIIPEGRTTLQKFEDWCKKSRLKVARGAYGKWIWQKDDADCQKLHRFLFGAHRVQGAIRRTPAQILGWPELQRILHPAELSAEQTQAYQMEWQAFQKEIMELNIQTGTEREKGLAALTRFRQKASLLRAAETAAFASDLIEEGHQVAISCQWLDSVKKIQEELEKLKIPAVTCTGRDFDREASRRSFQTGQARVILFTTEEGINLQQNEILADDRPRAQIDHDIRLSGIAMHQIDHRCHRNGKFAKVFWCYATKTKEAGITQKLFAKLNSMLTLAGDDKETISKLEDEFLSAARPLRGHKPGAHAILPD